MNMKKSVIAGMVSASLVFSGIVVPSSSAFAAEPTSNTVEQTTKVEHILTKDGYRAYVVNGYLIKLPASAPEPTEAELHSMLQERGKISLAIKAIKTIYHKLPKPVKKYIAQYLKLEGLLGFLDHWTGAVEDGIYHACKSAGMPDWMAWVVTKAITMLI